jgi:hypothetical protein
MRGVVRSHVHRAGSREHIRAAPLRAVEDEAEGCVFPPCQHVTCRDDLLLPRPQLPLHDRAVPREGYLACWAGGAMRMMMEMMIMMMTMVRMIMMTTLVIMIMTMIIVVMMMMMMMMMMPHPAPGSD